MKLKEYYCDNCDAVFKIKHDMSSDHYNVAYCPFCSDELILDEHNENEWEDFDD